MSRILIDFHQCNHTHAACNENRTTLDTMLALLVEIVLIEPRSNVRFKYKFT